MESDVIILINTFISMSFFIKRMQDHYRNGLNEDRDMRSFSGFYFFSYCIMSVKHVSMAIVYVVSTSNTFSWLVLFS